MTQPHIALIVARCRNGVIGNEGGIPWHLPEDLAFFKKTTMGHPCLMGRKTWDSLRGRALPGRLNVVITRQKDFSAPGATVVGSIEEALKAAGAAPIVFIMGGGKIYEQALPLVQTAYVTEIDAEKPGDTFFPQLPESEWERHVIRTVPATEKLPSYTFCRYERRTV